jgi:hypothetical protein
MTKVARSVGPFIDVGVPLACQNLSQIEFVRPVILLVWLVPWRPKNEWQRAVAPNDVEIVHGKILFSPITRRSNDGLVFAHHLLEVFDCLQRDIVFCVAKIHERAGVSAVLRNNYFDWTIWIDARCR